MSMLAVAGQDIEVFAWRSSSQKQAMKKDPLRRKKRAHNKEVKEFVFSAGVVPGQVGDGVVAGGAARGAQDPLHPWPPGSEKKGGLRLQKDACMQN